MARTEKDNKRPRTVKPHAVNIRWYVRNAAKRGPRKSMRKSYMVNERAEQAKQSVEAKANEEKAIAEFVKDSGINDATVRKLLNGENVYPATLQKIASLFDVTVVDLVDFKSIELPADTEADFNWYTKLHLSFYIDNNRKADGKIEWYFERIDLERDVDTVAGKCSYSGWIRNQFDNMFSVKAFLMDRHLFSILCTSVNSKYQLCFSASFTRQIHLDGTDMDEGKTFKALEGTWCGIDHLGRNAIYKMFICEPGIINCAELAGLFLPTKVLEEAALGYVPKDVPSKLDSLGEEIKEVVASKSDPVEAAAGKVPIDKPSGEASIRTRRQRK